MVGDLQVKICGLERDILAQQATCRDADIGDNSEIICILVIIREGSDLRRLKTVEIIIKNILVTYSQEKRENLETFNADDV